MMPVLPAIAIGTVVLVADQVPKLDFMPSCRASADGILGVKESVEACIRSESDARDQAAKQWSEFPAADRTSCTRLTTMGGGNRGTYSELLTCLEMKRDARKLPTEGGTVGRVAR
jgi:hypothetical protein